MKFLIAFLTFFAVRSLRNKLNHITSELSNVQPHVTMAGYYNMCWKLRELNSSGGHKRFKFYSHGLFIDLKIKDSQFVSVISTDDLSYKFHSAALFEAQIEEIDLDYIVRRNYERLLGVRSA